MIQNNLIHKGEIAGRNTCTCVAVMHKKCSYVFGDDLTLILKSIPDDGSLPSAGHLHVVTPHIEMLWQRLHHDLAHSDHTCQVCRRGTWHPCRNMFFASAGAKSEDPCNMWARI